MSRQKLILDVNKIFSALLKSPSPLREMILSEDFIFYAPNYVLTELFKNKEKLLRYSALPPAELLTMFGNVVEKVNFVSITSISTDNLLKARSLCADIDPKDFAYVGLSLELSIPIFSGDKQLKAGLRKKGVDIFFEFSPI